MQQQRGPTHTHAHCRPTKPPPSSSETRCRPDDDETICHFRSPNGHAVTSGFDFQHAVSWWCFAVTIALKCTYRHQPPHRTVLGQVDCFVQCEVVGSQIALDGVQPRDTRTPGGLFQLSDGGADRIISASASSSARAICPNVERRRDWIIAARPGCLVIHSFISPQNVIEINRIKTELN